MAGDGQVRTRYLTLSRGFYASDEPVVHFGLGKIKTIERLTIDWPSGVTQTLKDLAADRTYSITEPKESNSERTPTPQPLYVKSKLPIGGAHYELDFDDYARQPLLPQKYSQLGPGSAWGDGRWRRRRRPLHGSGKRHRGTPVFQRFWQVRDEKFRPLRRRQECEDMAPVFFDADGDGDRDLYVVSGGIECEPGDEVLRDRLYLNDGKGKFTKAAATALPDVRDSGGVACAADFDRDGDVDLFVGGRTIPGAVPGNAKEPAIAERW